MVKPPLLDGADALSAEIAREMITAGHWLTPFANGIRYPHHPPLLYWTIAVSFGIFDVSDWAARLPVALATLALFITTFRRPPALSFACCWLLRRTCPHHLLRRLPLWPSFDPRCLPLPLDYPRP